MISAQEIPELSAYRQYEDVVSLCSRKDYEDLVVFGKNDAEPVHRWFRFKEGFSSALLSTLLQEFNDVLPKKLALLDPYCGSGTALISAQFSSAAEIRAIGIERSPFIHFIAETKCAWQTLRHRSLLRDGDLAIEFASDLEVGLPDLSSIYTGRCISTHIASRLMAIDHAAQCLPSNSRFVRLGIAAAVEPLSKVRRDGRALRIVEKPRKLVRTALLENWSQMSRDVASLSTQIPCNRSKPTVLLGDGRDPSSLGIEDQSIDLILTSPPYPNNIDYSEVYKLELWILGFVKTRQEFLHLRHSTLRSHPTFNKILKIDDDFLAEVETGRLSEILGTVMTRLEATGEGWRARMLMAYFNDLWNATKNYHRVLTRSGLAILVIGNSLHGNANPALIASDLALAKIGECHGFSTHISVARGLKRRLAGNHFLRESIVCLKKSK